MPTELIEVFGHLTFLLIALSFLVRQMLTLRLLSILASLASIAYNFYVAEQPLWLVINWNLVFVGLNLFQIGRHLLEQRAQAFTAEEQALYAQRFGTLSPAEFRRLLRLARHESAAAGTCLVRAGEPIEQVLLIQQGEASVFSAGQEIARLEPGDFVAEGHLLGAATTSSSVTLRTPARFLSWDARKLASLLEREAQLQGAMQGLVACDLARKLTRQEGPLKAL